MITAENSSPLHGDGKTALYLRTLDVFAEDTVSVPSINM